MLYDNNLISRLLDTRFRRISIDNDQRRRSRCNSVSVAVSCIRVADTLHLTLAAPMTPSRFPSLSIFSFSRIQARSESSPANREARRLSSKRRCNKDNCIPFETVTSVSPSVTRSRVMTAVPPFVHRVLARPSFYTCRTLGAGLSCYFPILCWRDAAPTLYGIITVER